MSRGAAAVETAGRPVAWSRLGQTVVRVWDAIPLREPWRVLVPLLAVQWIALVLFVLSVHHNGWLFYQGGDQIWYWASSWLLGHGSITVPRVSYGWPLVLLPFSWIWGGSYLRGLPATLLLQVLVLVPLALYCMYDLGARIGGRVVGYLSALAWAIGPYLVIPLFVQRYHAKYVDQFLPHPLGLTAMADYPALVLLLVAAVLVVRAVQNGDLATALVAGLVAGVSAGMKPSNLIWIAAPIVLLLLTRRWREVLAFGIGLLPALGALALWKYRGFGYVPAFQSGYEPVRLAAGSSDTLLYPYHHYVHINWHQLHINQLQLGEFFFSVRVLEVAPVVGAIAVARRSWPAAAFLSIWFWAYVVLKGSSDNASVEDGSFFRYLLPAAPALLLMLAALPVLVPRVGPRLADRFRLPPARPLSRRVAVVAAVALGLVPLAAAGAVRPLKGPKDLIQVRRVATPVQPGIALEASVRNASVLLRWQPRGAAGTAVFYRVSRAEGLSDVHCDFRPGAADECLANTDVLATTRRTAMVDRPGPGTWTYRIGVSANYLDDPRLGDVFEVSRPVTVTVH